MYDVDSAVKLFCENRVVPVVVIEKAENAVPLAKALLTGGCSVIEVTLRTEEALEAIRTIVREVPEMKAGAGTVTNVELFKQAVDCGAQFVVSPGSSPELLQYASKCDTVFFPGVMTSSEIMVAREYGFKILKFFPAALAGGISALKTYGSVYNDVKFFPTGGINGENCREFLALPNVAALGGTWIATSKDIAAGRWEEITARVQAAGGK